MVKSVFYSAGIKGENPKNLMTDGCGNLMCLMTCYNSADLNWPQVYNKKIWLDKSSPIPPYYCVYSKDNSMITDCSLQCYSPTCVRFLYNAGFGTHIFLLNTGTLECNSLY